MGFWSEIAATAPAAVGAANTGVPGGNTTTRYQSYIKDFQQSMKAAAAADPEYQAWQANDARYTPDMGPGPAWTGQDFFKNWFQGLSDAQQADYKTSYNDVQSQNAKSFTGRLGSLAKFIPLAVMGAGLAGTGLLGASAQGFVGGAPLGAAEAVGGGATGLDFGAAFEGLSGGGATGLDFGAASEGLGGLPEWASGGSFNNPSLVSMPDVSPGMLSGTYNNPAFVAIPGLEGGNISAAGLGAEAGAASAADGQPNARASSFSGLGDMGTILPQLSNFGQGGWGVPAMRTLAGLYGLAEARKLKKLSQLPNPNDITGMPGYQAGLEAVRRSMASQGYQGSGNMMAALQKYGGDFYNQYVGQRIGSAQAQSGPVSGGLSSLALLANGLGGFGGW